MPCVMEYWSIGIMGSWNHGLGFVSLQEDVDLNIPSIHLSNVPIAEQRFEQYVSARIRAE